jgi:hypothetical protein
MEGTALNKELITKTGVNDTNIALFAKSASLTRHIGIIQYRQAEKRINSGEITA